MTGGFGSQPGLTSSTDTPSAPFILAGTPTVITGMIVSTATDVGNTGQTYILRAGLTVALISASKKFATYAVGGSGGAETAVGFLMHDVNMQGPDGVARDTVAQIAVGGQPVVDESLVYLLDAAAKLDFSGAQAAAGPITVVGQSCKFIWSSEVGAA
jgi:hypothetical protein